MAKRSALVIGAGISGYASAIALLDAGMDVTIIGDAPKKPTRAMSLWKNGREALRELGIEFNSVHPLDLVEVRSFAGDLLWTFPAGAWSGPGGACSVWHDDLLEALHNKLASRAETLANRRLWRFTDDGSRVHAVLDDGTECAATLLIGADGLYSTVREQLLGPETPHDLGQVMVSSRAQSSSLTQEFTGPGRLLGPGRAFACQSERARFIATRLGDEISWMATYQIGDSLDVFDFAPRPVRELCTKGEKCGPFRLHDRPSATTWTRGGVGLVGESAHPMTPELGQGACLSLEDAVFLEKSVKELGPRPGLAKYGRERRLRVDWISRLAHSMAVTSLPGKPRLALLRDRLLTLAAPPLARSVFDRLLAGP